MFQLKFSEDSNKWEVSVKEGYKRIFDILEEGVFIYNSSFEIIYVNSSGCVMRKIDRNLELPRKIEYVFPKNEMLCSAIKKTMSQRNAVFQERIKCKNYFGEQVSTQSSFYYIEKDSKKSEIIEITKRVDSTDSYIDNQFINKKIINMKRLDKRTSSYTFIDIIGGNEKLLRVKNKCVKAAKTSSSVLIYGETGTGKELFVQAIHNSSMRKNKAFIAQNCAAIPKELIESTFFGVEKGGFTGAESKKGLFEMANGGTLYLDELNSMPIEFQSKLLRTLQDGVIRRVGGNKEIRVDVRVIASVNETYEHILREKKIRSDLFFRLNVVNIEIPPLRERKDDIPTLIEHFIDKFNMRFNADIHGIESKTLNHLVMREWIGNVRELEHAIEGVFNIRNEGIICLEDFQFNESYDKEDKKRSSLKEKLNKVEKECIEEALAISKGNLSKAAELLSIPRQTLQYRIKKLF